MGIVEDMQFYLISGTYDLFVDVKDVQNLEDSLKEKNNVVHKEFAMGHLSMVLSKTPKHLNYMMDAMKEE